MMQNDDGDMQGKVGLDVVAQRAVLMRGQGHADAEAEAEAEGEAAADADAEAEADAHLDWLCGMQRVATMVSCLMASVPLHAQVTLSAPQGGWRAAPSQQNDFVQEVHYPAASVNTNGIAAAALIRGRIAQSDKPGKPVNSGTSATAARSGPSADADDTMSRRPATLVVDGIAMPLLTDEAGNFARPWSFGTGNHGVIVRAPDGSVARRTFYEAQPNRTPTRLRVVLSWDSDGTDLDLHVISPDGAHVFYGQRTAANGGALDVDVTTGFGPEIFATPNPVRGGYQVYVNYFGAGERRDVITVAQIAVVQDEGTLREKQQVFRVPMRKPGELTRVASFLVQ